MAEPLDSLVDGKEIDHDNHDDGDNNESSEGEDTVEVEDENEQHSFTDDSVEVEDEIVDKFICTFHYCDYDIEFDNELKLDRVERETFLARPTQALYNKLNNWGERNQIGLEKVKIQLQNFTLAM